MTHCVPCTRSILVQPWLHINGAAVVHRVRILGGMPGVAFVAHCLLNQHSKCSGGARCPGVYSPLVGALRERGWQIQQMPCPELAFTGLNRFWAVREQLDTSAYRRHCRRLAKGVAGTIEVHVRAGDDVVLVGLEGSPSMGVHVTSSDPERGAGRGCRAGTAALPPGGATSSTAPRPDRAERGGRPP